MNRIGQCYIFRLLAFGKSEIKFVSTSRLYSQKLDSKNKTDAEKLAKDIDLDFDDLKKRLDESLQQSVEGKETEVDKSFMNFTKKNQVKNFGDSIYKKLILYHYKNYCFNHFFY